MEKTERLVAAGLVLALVSLLLGGCSQDSGKAAGRAQGTPEVEPAAGCTESNFLSCNFEPFPDIVAGGCDQLKRNLAGRRVNGETVAGVNSCSSPVLSDPIGDVTAAAVAAELEVDGPPSHAAFLFLRSDEGWRLMDPLLDVSWTHGGHCDARFQFRWEAKDAGFEAILDSQSERICRMPLDQDELAAGEPDIASVECKHARYGLRQTKLEKLLSETSEKKCAFK